VPDPLTVRSVNLTTPLTALTVVVPLKVPLPLAIAAVTATVDVVTRVFVESRTSTTGCGDNGDPDAAPPG
jgi:hypothetical protein